MIEDPYLVLIDPDPGPAGAKTYGSGSATLRIPQFFFIHLFYVDQGSNLDLHSIMFGSNANVTVFKDLFKEFKWYYVDTLCI
jgi:hypothetical protein